MWIRSVLAEIKRTFILLFSPGGSLKLYPTNNISPIQPGLVLDPGRQSPSWAI
jgi:hypothetical protein